MQEVKLIATRSAGVPVIAIVLGAIITAEPGASRGIWCGSQGVQDIFAIINGSERENLIRTIQLMNERSVYISNRSNPERVAFIEAAVNTVRQSLPIDMQILQYMQWFPELKHQQIIKSIKS